MNILIEKQLQESQLAKMIAKRNNPEYKLPSQVIEEQKATIAKQAERIAKLEAALTRLRDCDWVIRLPDRMDAVRDIAKEALEG